MSFAAAAAPLPTRRLENNNTTTTAAISSGGASGADANIDWPRVMQRDDDLVCFRRTFFANDAVACQRFLTGFLGGRCLVFHTHHYAMQALWLDALRVCRVNALSARSPNSFGVYYTLIVDDPKTRLPTVGMCYYSNFLAIKALCRVLCERPSYPLSSLFEIPRALLQAIVRSESPALLAHVRSDWLCAQCYEKVLLDSTDLVLTADSLLLDLLFHDDFVMATDSADARLNKAECRSLLRVKSDTEARQQLMSHYRRHAEARAVPGLLGGGGTLSCSVVPRSPDDIPTHEVTAFIARDWQEQLRRRAERSSANRELTSDTYVLCAYVLFIIVAMRFHAEVDQCYEQRRRFRLGGSAHGAGMASSSSSIKRLTVAELLTLFPVCMAVVRGENTDYVNDALDKCEQASPGVCEALIQHVADTVREFMLNPHTAGHGDGRLPTPSLVLMLNIRTCVEPLIQRFDELRRVLHTTLSVSSSNGGGTISHSSSSSSSSSASSRARTATPTPAMCERRQRATFHRVDYATVDAFLFDVLLERTIDVAAFNSLAAWMHTVAAGPAGSTINTPTLDVNDHVALRRMAETLNAQYTVVCFFDVNRRSASVASAVPVDFFTLTGTLDFLAHRYPDLQLNTLRMRHVGYTASLGAFLVVHKDVLWMLRHAMLNSVLTADRRVYQKNTPVYPLLLSTYVARNTSTSDELLAFIEQHDHRALFLPRDANDAAPRHPLAHDPNVFALRCMIDTLAEWLGLSSIVLEDGSSWRYGVPTPRSQHFGAMRFLHRLVDQLQVGHDEAVRVATPPPPLVLQPSLASRLAMPIDTGLPSDDPSQEYFIDTDAAALNAIRSFLQLRLPHTIGYDTYMSLCQQFPLFSTHATTTTTTTTKAKDKDKDKTRSSSSSDDDDEDDVAFAFFSSTSTATHTAPSLHIVELTQLLHALAPLASEARDAWRRDPDNGAYVYCNTMLRQTHALYRVGNLSTNEPRPSKQSVAGGSQKRSSSSSSSSSSSQPPTKAARNTGTTSTSFARRTGADSCRVPILCTQAVLDALPRTHSLNRIVDEHERIAHANLLFYSASLSDALSLHTSYALLCDLHTTERPIDPAQLFDGARYAGTHQTAVANFRYVKQHYERDILKPRGHARYGCGRVALAYSPLEPMDALSRLLMRLDYRHTCGTAPTPLATYAVADTLPVRVQCREVDADAEKQLSEVDIHTALPMHIDIVSLPNDSKHTPARDIYYADNTFMLYTTTAYEECQAHLGHGARAALELTTAMTNYRNMAELAAQLRQVYQPQFGQPRDYEPQVWLSHRRERARLIEAEYEKARREHHRMVESCGLSFAAFQAALEFDDPLEHTMPLDSSPRFITTAAAATAHADAAATATVR